MPNVTEISPRLPGSALTCPDAGGWLVAGTSKRLVLVLAALSLLAGGVLTAIPTFLVGAQLNDLFLFVDWIHRWGAGQIPHRDYHAPLGFLATLPPALGFWLTGDYARALRVNDVLALTALAGPLVLACRTRLTNGLTLIVWTTLATLLLVPLDLFNLWAEPTPAMAYNRHGWAVVAVAALFLAPTRGAANPRVELLVLALLCLWLAWLKATYGLACGLVGLLYCWVHRPRPREFVPGALAALALFGIVEASWGITAPYLRDLAFAASVDGSGRMSIGRILHTSLTSAGDMLFGAVLPAVLVLGVLGRRGIVPALVIAALAGLSIGIILQNAQVRGLPLLVSAAAIGVAAVDRAGLGRAARLLALLLPLAAAAPLLELAARTTDGTLRVFLRGEAGGTDLPGLAGLRVREQDELALATRAMANGLTARDYAQAASRQGFGGTSLKDWLSLTRQALDLVGQCRLRPGGGSVLLADFANPLPALAGLTPAGRFPVLHADRSFSPLSHPPVEAVLEGVGCVIEPLLPMVSTSTDLFMRLYGDEVRRRLGEAVETPFFRIYRRP